MTRSFRLFTLNAFAREPSHLGLDGGERRSSRYAKTSQVRNTHLIGVLNGLADGEAV